jgi:probable rRNA maturation factor
MRVSVTSHRDPEPLDPAAFQRVAEFVLGREDVVDQAELSIALVDEEEIGHLNAKYRGEEHPTDVLSFGCDDPCPADSDEPITLGDVVIAPTVAERRARERGARVEDELDLLVVHGILHILGYEHDTEESAKAMEDRERAILDAYEDFR